MKVSEAIALLQKVPPDTELVLIDGDLVGEVSDLLVIRIGPGDVHPHSKPLVGTVVAFYDSEEHHSLAYEGSVDPHFKGVIEL
jgi:hypothetical protein